MGVIPYTNVLRLLKQTVFAKTDIESGQVAQLVEQWTENPRAEGSSPPLTTMNSKAPLRWGFFYVCEI